jgi:hypothetical protein
MLTLFAGPAGPGDIAKRKTNDATGSAPSFSIEELAMSVIGAVLIPSVLWILEPYYKKWLKRRDRNDLEHGNGGGQHQDRPGPQQNPFENNDDSITIEFQPISRGENHQGDTPVDMAHPLPAHPLPAHLADGPNASAPDSMASLQRGS